MEKERSKIDILLDQCKGTRLPEGEGILDTPEKIKEYEERMREATKEGFEFNRRARAMSWLSARNHIVY